LEVGEVLELFLSLPAAPAQTKVCDTNTNTAGFYPFEYLHGKGTD
jgi:hypothetical protein